MELVYKNFRIEWNEESFTLYSKSLKSDKLIGYYSKFESLLKRMIIETNGANKELIKYYKEYLNAKLKLKHLSTIIYLPIKKLDEDINGIRKIQGTIRS
jgi:hypothetical protein